MTTELKSVQMSQEYTLWIDRESKRLTRDQREINRFAPQLMYHPPSFDYLPHGGWSGELPRWPFKRQRPSELDSFLGKDELKVVVVYPAAYPMVAPVIYSLNPKPTFWEESQAAWHVAPGGSLCLFQNDGGWCPEASIIDLLEKAAGWRIEYVLMKSGLIEKMSTNGIVCDSSSDILISQAVQQRATQQSSVQEASADVTK